MVGETGVKGHQSLKLLLKKGLMSWFLQETCTNSIECSYALSHGASFHTGTAVLFRQAANTSVLFVTEVVKGQLLVVTTEVENHVFCLVNMALNKEPVRVFILPKLQNELNNFKWDHLIICKEFKYGLD